MLLQQVLAIDAALDRKTDLPQALAETFAACGYRNITATPARGSADTTFIRLFFPGSRGKARGGDAPTLGVVGQLGGLAAVSHRPGLVSDADGALASLTLGLKLAEMAARRMHLAGDVIITTHLCPDAQAKYRDPAHYIVQPVDIQVMTAHMVEADMDAIISIDATKGNTIINKRGVAITPTVKSGYILRVSPGLMAIQAQVTGEQPLVLPITTQDITTNTNGIRHINSIMQPATATSAPVVGLAVTSGSVIPGSATEAGDPMLIEQAARFCLRVAQDLPEHADLFYDAEEYDRLIAMYGDLSFLTALRRS